VSLRKDTLSHAYELLKVQDQRKRRKLAGQVARGELSLVRLREKIDGRTPRVRDADEADPGTREPETPDGQDDRDERDAGYDGHAAAGPIRDDSLVSVKQQLADAVEGLADILGQPEVMRAIGDTDRQNLAKYLTIAKLKLENAIAIVRRG
jgi:hypothetical protein